MSDGAFNQAEFQTALPGLAEAFPLVSAKPITGVPYVEFTPPTKEEYALRETMIRDRGFEEGFANMVRQAIQDLDNHGAGYQAVVTGAPAPLNNSDDENGSDADYARKVAENIRNVAHAEVTATEKKAKPAPQWRPALPRTPARR